METVDGTQQLPLAQRRMLQNLHQPPNTSVRPGLNLQELELQVVTIMDYNSTTQYTTAPLHPQIYYLRGKQAGNHMLACDWSM